MSNLGLDFDSILSAISGAPQTQRDVHALATAAPVIQQEIEDAKPFLFTIAGIYLAATVIGTAATVYATWLQHQEYVKKHGRKR